MVENFQCFRKVLFLKIKSGEMQKWIFTQKRMSNPAPVSLNKFIVLNMKNSKTK